MHFGASMFCTDYSMAPVELAPELENRGFESFWAPEHSHIPLSRKSPWGGGPELPKHYYDVIDPFVGLATAAVATKTLKLATGVCLIIQRDPIQLAKEVATLDPAVRRPLPVRHRRRLEPGGNGRPRHRSQDPASS